MRILLVQTSFLGDTILSTAVIGALKALHPESELWMMTTKISAELVCNNPNLKGVIVYDKRTKDRGLPGLYRKAQELRALDFKRVYSLHKSYRTSLLLFFAKIPLRIGFAQSALSFLYHIKINRDRTQHDVLRNLSILSNETSDLKRFAKIQINPAPNSYVLPDNYAVIAPGSVWHTKRWHEAGFKQVASYLLQQGLKVILVGGSAELTSAQQVAKGIAVENLAGKTSISELVSLIKHAKIVVCNDSMVLHVAASFQIPTVAVFCATTPDLGFGPWNNPHARVVEQTNLWCKPCGSHGAKRCPTGTEACINLVQARHVIAALEQVLCR